MNPIVIFYHCCTDLNRDYAFPLIKEQMETLKSVGLVDASEDIIIGLNGTQDDADELFDSECIPFDSIVLVNTPEICKSGEIGTMRAMAEWVQGYPDRYYLYFHTKGLSYPPSSPVHAHYNDWRKRMESVVLHRWRECVAHLDAGAESVGQWWNVAPNGSYWAGNFFWATGEFLATLPYLNIEGHHSGGRFEAEVWIGRGPRLPRFVSL